MVFNLYQRPPVLREHLTPEILYLFSPDKLSMHIKLL